MAATGSADLQSVIEKRVSNIVTETLIQDSVALGVVKQYPVASGMDRLDIPLFGSMSVVDVVEGVDLTPETISAGTAKLDLNRQKAVAWAISKRAEVQSKINAVTQAVKNGSRELAAEIDDFIFAAMVAGTGDTKGLAADFSGDALAALADSKAQMDLANVPKNGRFIIASPLFISNLLGNNNVINVDKYGSENPIQSGFVTRVYGFTIVESSSASVPAGGYICEQMESTAFARQMNIMLLRQEQALGVRDDYSMSHLYGSILTDTGSKRIVIVTA
tara:strand:- start:786 stop:1613 length:828 start_codon:yes stop_codon:yes gene_type:complete